MLTKKDNMSPKIVGANIGNSTWAPNEANQADPKPQPEKKREGEHGKLRNNGTGPPTSAQLKELVRRLQIQHGAHHAVFALEKCTLQVLTFGPTL